MPDRFAPIPASELAAAVGGELIGPDAPVIGICALDRPVAGHLCFARGASGQEAAIASALQAGATVLVTEAPAGVPGTCIQVDRPRDAFAMAFRALLPGFQAPGIHPTAVIDTTAVVPASTHVGPHAVIGPEVILGEHCVIKSHAVIGEPGLAVGTDADGNNLRMPHAGGVRIGAFVEVGSHATVCAGTINPTVIEDYAKLDDHVHLAHNCRVGRNAIITAGAVIAGSVRIGDGVWIGPQAAITDGVAIGDGAFIGIGAVVSKDCESSGVYAGNPARKFGER